MRNLLDHIILHIFGYIREFKCVINLLYVNKKFNELIKRVDIWANFTPEIYIRTYKYIKLDEIIMDIQNVKFLDHGINESNPVIYNKYKLFQLVNADFTFNLMKVVNHLNEFCRIAEIVSIFNIKNGSFYDIIAEKISNGIKLYNLNNKFLVKVLTHITIKNTSKNEYYGVIIGDNVNADENCYITVFFKNNNNKIGLFYKHFADEIIKLKDYHELIRKLASKFSLKEKLLSDVVDMLLLNITKRLKA